MGAVKENTRKGYIQKILENHDDTMMDADSYLEFLETMSLDELEALAEDCE